MTEEIALYLLTEAGRALLAQANAFRESQVETLAALSRLRQSASPEQAAAAWSMSELRRRAFAKFGALAPQMYFVREGLEQASSARAARYHATRFVQAGVASVADLCGGLGGDALAFAQVGLQVTLYEQDPVRARFAEENIRVSGLADSVTVRQADVMQERIMADAVWFDPARRTEGRRATNPEDYAPPLSWLHELEAQGITSIGVKLAPAIEHRIAKDYGAELEFLSDGGECKEALLWRGALRSGDLLRATVFAADSVQTLAGAADDGAQATCLDGRYLYEPDPAVIRAHLVGTLAVRLAAAPVDPQIAYLVSDVLIDTPFATAYEIVQRFSYSRRRLQDALTNLDIGTVVIKKRGFPLEPDAVRKQLKLRGSKEIIVILARVGDGHQVFLCQRVAGNRLPPVQKDSP